MTARVLSLLAMLATFLLMALLWWSAEVIPAPRFPEWAPAQRRAISNIHREHGAVTIKRVSMCWVYFERGGRKIWIEM